jgi:hypothetical protein
MDRPGRKSQEFRHDGVLSYHFGPPSAFLILAPDEYHLRGVTGHEKMYQLWSQKVYQAEGAFLAEKAVPSSITRKRRDGWSTRRSAWRYGHNILNECASPFPFGDEKVTVSLTWTT